MNVGKISFSMENKRSKVPEILAFIVFSLLIGIVIFFHKYNENYIYFWDTSGYWKTALSFSETFFSKPGMALNQLYQSILHDEYSKLPIMLILPFIKLIGKGHLTFVMSIYVVYYLPFCLFMYIFLRKQFAITKNFYKIITMAFLFAFPPLFTPLMGGYLDVCGLTFIALLLLLIQRFNMASFNVPKALALGILTLIICFLRRWYLFWIVGFYVGYICSIIIVSISKHGKQRKFIFSNDNSTIKTIFSSIANLFVAGFFWLLILFLLFRPFFDRTIFNTYSDSYSAYNLGGISYNFTQVVNNIGWLIVVLAAIGLLCMFLSLDKIGIMLIFNSAIVIFLFTSVQSLGVQHIYLFLPTIIYLTLKILFLIPLISEEVGSAVFSAFGIIICLIFVNTYYNHKTFLSVIDGISPQKKMYRKNRDDINEINNLVEFINEETNGESYTYVLASSMVLNVEILENSQLPFNQKPIEKLFYTMDVDSRSEFPKAFYAADYLVIAHPTQYHLAPQNQQLIGVLSDQIINGDGIKSLKLLKEFNLDNDVVAGVYKKTKCYSEKFLEDVDEIFKTNYPQNEKLSDTVSIFSYLYDFKLEKEKNMIIEDNDTFGLEIGMEETKFKINTKNFNKISFTGIANYETETGKEILFKDYKGAKVQKVEISAGKTNISINVSKIDELEIVFVSKSNNIENLYYTIDNIILE